MSDPNDDNDSPAAEPTKKPAAAPVRFSHVTTGRYLPLPGKAPGWPFAEVGHWQIDANASADDWLAGLHEWRREHLVRIGWTTRTTAARSCNGRSAISCTRR